MWSAPALGGVLLAAAGADVTFIVNAVSFLAVVWVLARHDHVKRTSARVVAGSLSLVPPLREVWSTLALRGAFVAVAGFGASGCVLMAILPAFAKHALGASASGYGALLSALGAGAITAGLLLSRMRARFGTWHTVSAGAGAFGAATWLACHAPSVATAMPCFYVAGVGWTSCFTTLSATVQLVASTASKSRVTALYQLNFYAWATVGTVMGGALAERSGERVAVSMGAMGCLLTGLTILGVISLGDVDARRRRV